MATTTYNLIAVQGELIAHQHQSGGIRSYGRDAVGSAVTLFNSSGAAANTYRYKPYGAQLSKTGVEADTWYLWNAASGYRIWSTPKSYSEYYVRARHYGFRQRYWTTVDPRWPEEHSYVYTGANPTTFSDPSGQQHTDPRCGCPPGYPYLCIPTGKPNVSPTNDPWKGLRYKKYCGAGGGSGPAENGFDKCCKDHDACWEQQQPPCDFFNFDLRGDCWYCDDRFCTCLAKNANCPDWDLKCKIVYELAVELFCRKRPRRRL